MARLTLPRPRFFGGISGLLAALALASGCSSDSKSEQRAGGGNAIDLSCPGEALSPVPLRRLTRFEYQNALSDVLGSDITGEDFFPKDEVALGFDNQSGTLGTTDLHVEGYLEVATQIAESLASDPA